MSHRKRMVGLVTLILFLAIVTGLLANLPSYGTTTTGRTVITGGVIYQGETPKTTQTMISTMQPIILEEETMIPTEQQERPQETTTQPSTTLSPEEQYALTHELAYYAARKLQRPVMVTTHVEELITITSELKVAGIKEGMTIEEIALNKELRNVFRSALDYY